MSRIDGLSQVMEVLRRQMAENAKKLEKGRTTPSTISTDPNKVNKISAQDLQQRIRERLRPLGSTTGYNQKAARIFLESVLTWEFGEDLVHDPRFTDLLNEINQTMETDAELKMRLQTLIQQLQE